jgi:FkbM family methyltransferase
VEEHFRGRLNDNQIYLGLDTSNLAVFEGYKKVSEPKKGFYTDFSGVRTRLSYFGIESHPAELEPSPVPFPDDALHAETIEYLAALTAVESANGSFTAVELGAGYGPWIVFSAKAAQQRGLGPIKLKAVEADLQRHELMRSNLGDNGLPVPEVNSHIAEDGIDVSLVHGAVSDKNGTLSFGSQSLLDWGASPIEGGGSVDYRGMTVDTDIVNAYTIESVLADLQTVDFMHMDIQGFEYKAIRASLDSLQRKVRVLLIATHSRQLEGEIMGLLHDNGWRLQYEKPCKFTPDSGKDLTALTYLDGTQVWINTALGQPAVVNAAVEAEENVALRAANERHARELLAIKNSTSWKVTEPLRWVKTLISRGK